MRQTAVDCLAAAALIGSFALCGLAVAGFLHVGQAREEFLTERADRQEFLTACAAQGMNVIACAAAWQGSTVQAPTPKLPAAAERRPGHDI